VFIPWGCGVDSKIPQIFERLFSKKKKENVQGKAPELEV